MTELQSDTAWGRRADSLSGGAETDRVIRKRLTNGLAGAAFVAGKNGHRERCRISPDVDSGCAPAISQRWLPVRRQHEGRSDAGRAGVISEELNRINSNAADRRRT
jgi:hypothetical protein